MPEGRDVKQKKKAKDACKTGHFLILYKTPS